MVDEIEEAAQRFLAFLPEETQALLDGAEHILGMTQLVAENAKRCGVKAKGDGLDWGLGNEWWDEEWNICGVYFSISEPDNGDPWVATPRGERPPKIEALTFPELFDRIVEAAQAVLDTVEEPDTDSDTASEWTPNFWHCGPPLFTGVPKCGGL